MYSIYVISKIRYLPLLTLLSLMTLVIYCFIFYYCNICVFNVSIYTVYLFSYIWNACYGQYHSCYLSYFQLAQHNLQGISFFPSLFSHPRISVTSLSFFLPFELEIMMTSYLRLNFSLNMSRHFFGCVQCSFLHFYMVIIFSFKCMHT